MIKRMRQVVMVFLLMMSLSLDAQDYLYGKVVDESGIALMNVDVHWETKKETERDKQLTKPDGTFSLKLLKDTTIALSIKYPGKKDVLKFISESEFNEFILVKLEEKGVTSLTASRWEQDVNEIPASVIVISREEIAQNGYITLQEILENVPGLFTIDHRSETGITIGVRGFWAGFNRNVMIQVNGVNMLSERKNDFPFHKINMAVEAIDKIEIVRGPMSVIYGAGAFFGVINIITNDSETNNKGHISSGIGLPYSQTNSFRYTAEKESFKLSFNAWTFKRDGFDERFSDMTSQSVFAADQIKVDTGGYVGYPNPRSISYYQDSEINKERYSSTRQGFNLSSSIGGFFTNIHYLRSDFGFSFLHPGPRDRNQYKSETGNYQVGYRGSIKRGKFDYEIKTSYMKSHVEPEFRYWDASAFATAENNVSSFRTEINTRTVLLDSKRNNGANLDIISGIYFSRNFENNSNYNAPEFNLNNWYVGLAPGSNLDTKAMYLQSEFKKGKLQIVGGLRIEHESNYKMISSRNTGYGLYSDSLTPFDIGYSLDSTSIIKESYLKGSIKDHDPEFIPRLAVLYELSTNNKRSQYFKLLYGQAVKQATVAQNTNDVRVANQNNFGDDSVKYKPFLKPEKITTFEFGYTFVDKPSRWEINANVFQNNLSNLITRETSFDGTDYIAFSTNSGEIRTRGVELILKKVVRIPIGSKKLILNTNGSVTYQVTKHISEVGPDLDAESRGDTVSFSPPIFGTFRITGVYGRFSFGAGINYVGKMKSEYSIGNENSGTGKYIGEDVNGYERVSANMRLSNIRIFKEDKGGFYFNLKVSNLLNRTYYYPTHNTNRWADKGVLGRPRQFLLTIGHTF